MEIKRYTPRVLAAITVDKIISSGAYSNIELSSSERNKLSEKDNSLYHAIVKTVIERKNTIEYVLSGFVKKSPERLTKSLLYIGTAQILFMEKIPDNASCDETVKAAKLLTDNQRSGFINAVLRNICRSKADLYEKIENSDDEIKYSLDKSICRLIKEQYLNECNEIFGILNGFSHLPLVLRVNYIKNTEKELSAFLTENGIKNEIHEKCEFVYENFDKALDFIDTGRFFVQGYGSVFAGNLLDAKPGMTVVDVCACPGGKSLGAAVDMQNIGKVYARDIHGGKFSLLKKSAEILGVDIIETAEADSRKVCENLVNIADRVICDVPCSSLGVMVTKPEIRYKDISNLDSLYKTQKEILDSASEYLKKGGIMVYSTCTVNKKENGDMINEFLETHKNFERVSEKQFISENNNFDGFYACKLIRKE